MLTLLAPAALPLPTCCTPLHPSSASPLSTHCVPGTVLGTAGMAESKTAPVPAFLQDGYWRSRDTDACGYLESKRHLVVNLGKTSVLVGGEKDEVGRVRPWRAGDL